MSTYLSLCVHFSSKESPLTGAFDESRLIKFQELLRGLREAPVPIALHFDGKLLADMEILTPSLLLDLQALAANGMTEFVLSGFGAPHLETLSKRDRELHLQATKNLLHRNGLVPRTSELGWTFRPTSAVLPALLAEEMAEHGVRRVIFSQQAETKSTLAVPPFVLKHAQTELACLVDWRVLADSIHSGKAREAITMLRKDHPRFGSRSVFVELNGWALSWDAVHEFLTKLNDSNELKTWIEIVPLASAHHAAALEYSSSIAKEYLSIPETEAIETPFQRDVNRLSAFLEKQASHSPTINLRQATKALLSCQRHDWLQENDDGGEKWAFLTRGWKEASLAQPLNGASQTNERHWRWVWSCKQDGSFERLQCFEHEVDLTSHFVSSLGKLVACAPENLTSKPVFYDVDLEKVLPHSHAEITVDFAVKGPGPDVRGRMLARIEESQDNLRSRTNYSYIATKAGLPYPFIIGSLLELAPNERLSAEINEGDSRLILKQDEREFIAVYYDCEIAELPSKGDDALSGPRCFLLYRSFTETETAQSNISMNLSFSLIPQPGK